MNRCSSSLMTRPLMALILLAAAMTGVAGAQTLRGFASLPADSFAPGPTSGQFITGANGVTPPFHDQQPIQGVSSVLRAGNGDFLVMSDNGFGAKNNSADYVLRVYRIAPEFKTRRSRGWRRAVTSPAYARSPGPACGRSRCS